jgi:hypothetical protein
MERDGSKRTLRPSWVLLGLAALLIGTWYLLRIPDPERGRPRYAKISLPKDLADRPALIRSAHQLWWVNPGQHHDPAECLEVLGILERQLSEGEWTAVLAPVFRAWGALRGNISVRESLLTQTPRLATRFFRLGTMSELEELLRWSRQKSFDAQAISRAAGEVFLRRAEGGEQRSLELICAALRIEDHERASDWIADLLSDDTASDHARFLCEKLSNVIRAGSVLTDRKKYDIQVLVGTWGEVEGTSIAGKWIRPFLLKLGLLALRAEPAEWKGTRCGELILETSTIRGSEGYWERILREVVADVARDIYEEIPRLEQAAVGFAKAFKRPEYPTQAWWQVARLGSEKWWDNPLWVVAHLERALRTALDDPSRAGICKEISHLFKEAREYEKSRLVLEQCVSQVSDALVRQEVSLFLEDARKTEEADRKRVAKERQENDARVLKGQLAYAKEQLKRARAQNRPAEDLASLQALVKTLEKQLLE